jgi:hypothetical protein
MACWLADDNIFQAGLTKTEGNNILSTCYNGYDGHEAKGQKDKIGKEDINDMQQ